ncbi:hypothetical protein TNCV_4432131 [Trichonephila clavipes]|nr:hypothetical protein TNCV_4432131 [Trichonephila clavipes]
MITALFRNINGDPCKILERYDPRCGFVGVPNKHSNTLLFFRHFSIGFDQFYRIASISIANSLICCPFGIMVSDVDCCAVGPGDEAHFWLNGYVNKQNCRIWSEANPQVCVETPLHPEKLTVWCALGAGGILLQK